MIFYNAEIFRLALCEKLGFLTASMSLRERHFTVRQARGVIALCRFGFAGHFRFLSSKAYARVKADIFVMRYRTEPNQALLPTPMSVTTRACARVAPATGAADL